MSDKFTFAVGNNAEFLENLYRTYCEDPARVDRSWQQFFAGFEFATKGASLRSAPDDTPLHATVEAMINSFRRLGHLCAQLNPLALNTISPETVIPELVELRTVEAGLTVKPANFGDRPLALQDIIEGLTNTYCRSIGADFRESNDVNAVQWWQNKMESCQNQPLVSAEAKQHIFNKLVAADGFEKFLQARYLGQKRFSVEGLDSLIPLLDTIINEFSSRGYEEICLGMAHRGRLNILVNVLGKPYAAMLKEFEGGEVTTFDIDGDVKYHMGFCGEVATASQRPFRVYLAPNPSHLEAINPVIEGFTKCRQLQFADSGTAKIVPILLHGDAAFAGQGVVAETLNLSQLAAYQTGGTIHVITNNQIGFTTDPNQGRSCHYSSDISKVIRAPVIHVNADDPEAVVWAAQMAVQFRHEFHQDVVLDLIGYRRHGHNETDEPSFTQPKMYQIIADRPPLVELYQQKLIAEKIITVEQAQEKIKAYRAKLQAAYEQVHNKKYNPPPENVHPAFNLVYRDQRVTREDAMSPVETMVKAEVLTKLGNIICTIPKKLTINPKLARVISGRQQMLDGDGTIDWAFAELLAFATLAQEGFNVRLSGQDSQRGTFSSRQGVYVDIADNRVYEPLQQIGPGKVELINSPLSEFACLGFEFGYAVADPYTLVLWEAQFGDFANGGQIIIDQFIMASEAKWQQATGLVLLLPHGNEGMGPEHSSARPERFLQGCGNLNVQVCNVTTPAQLFHVLRRQLLRKFRKPLVLMTPKSLLRHPKMVSSFKEFSDATFQEIVVDFGKSDAKKVEQLLLCTGKISFELAEYREQQGLTNLPILRVEQLYPFPREAIGKVVGGLSHLKSIVWIQEEPQNMGGWSFVFPRLQKLLNKKIDIFYVGRRHSGSTAEGSGKAHQLEQTRIVAEALNRRQAAHSPKAQLGRQQ